MSSQSSAQQGTEAWLLDRLGHVTGSRFHDVIAVGRGGKPLEARETAITEVTLELITGQPGAMWSSKATRWGKEHESHARAAYEIATGHMCQEVGFITHSKHRQVGCSPDSLIGADGGWEAKCPLTPTVHLKTLLGGMPAEHMAQCQGGMWICGRQWWDFVSYHPAFPPGMQLYRQRIERDDDYIAHMESRVLDAVAEININARELLAKFGVNQ